MTTEKRSFCASALGAASALVYLLFNFRRLCGFVREQFVTCSYSGSFGHVFLMGREWVLQDLSTVALYDVLFKAVPFLAQGVFLAWTFGAWTMRRDVRLRGMLPVGLLVLGFSALSDGLNLVATDCFGEAGVLSSLRDAFFFHVFLVHRLTPLVFYAIICRKGVSRPSPAVWALMCCHGACVIGVAVAQIASFPEAKHADAWTHAVYGTALAVSSFLMACGGRTSDAEICYNTDSKGSLT